MSKKVKRISDFLSHTVVVGILLFIAMYYPSIPDRIPIHYDMYGQCDAMGDKSNLFIVLGIMVGGYILLGLISRYPHRFNYPFEIKEANKLRAYSVAAAMVKALRVVFMLTFACITIFTALSVRFLTSAFTLTILISITLIIIIGSICMSKANKGH